MSIASSCSVPSTTGSLHVFPSTLSSAFLSIANSLLPRIRKNLFQRGVLRNLKGGGGVVSAAVRGMDSEEEPGPPLPGVSWNKTHPHPQATAATFLAKSRKAGECLQLVHPPQFHYGGRAASFSRTSLFGFLSTFVIPHPIRPVRPIRPIRPRSRRRFHRIRLPHEERCEVSAAVCYDDRPTPGSSYPAATPFSPCAHR